MPLSCQSRFVATAVALSAAACGRAGGGTRVPVQESYRVPRISCFLLSEQGVGEVRRSPAVGCDERVTPASTFKIPHALAALDSGVVADPSTVLPYDGSAWPFASWRHDQTLASAMRYSVLWYFQHVAEALGPDREHQYLAKFHYGNEDNTGNPRRFWIEDSLMISPNEQLKFLQRLYANALPVSAFAMDTVRKILVEPSGSITNASGSHEFGTPWSEETVVSAKTGRGNFHGVGVHWLVGSVHRDTHTWVFVSCVTGRTPEGQLPAVDLAAHALREERVL